jgi:prepilin signal peptidase PulO-like enzyme (type II secretory pathway)
MLHEIIIFLFGLCVGSFLNAVIFRLEKGKSIVFDKKRSKSSTSLKKLNSFSALSLNNLARSYCPHCRKTLKWYDLAPVLSFFILRGECRYCGKKISWQYPVVEAATGIIFLAIFNFSPYGGPPVGWQFLVSSSQLLIPLIFWLYIASVLIIIFVYDLKHYIIPDKILFPAIILSIFYLFCNLKIWNLFEIWNLSFDAWQPLLFYLASAVGASVFFLFFVLVSRGRWMGLGDVKLAFLMGLILGWPNILVALFLAFALGAAVGLALILAGRLRLPKPSERLCKPAGYSLKSEIPFAPFLIAGTFIALLWGSQLANWYLGMLF